MSQFRLQPHELLQKLRHYRFLQTCLLALIEHVFEVTPKDIHSSIKLLDIFCDVRYLRYDAAELSA